MQSPTATRLIAFCAIVAASCAGSSPAPSAPTARSTPSAATASGSTIGTEFCKKELQCEPGDFQNNYGGVTCVDCDPVARCNVTHDRLAMDPDCGAPYRVYLECMLTLDCSTFAKADDKGGPCEEASNGVAACILPD